MSVYPYILGASWLDAISYAYFVNCYGGAHAIGSSRYLGLRLVRNT